MFRAPFLALCIVCSLLPSTCRAQVANWLLSGSLDPNMPLPADTVAPDFAATLRISPGLVGVSAGDAFIARDFPTGALNPAQYFEVEIVPGAGYSATYTALTFHLYSLFSGASADYEVRSSVDGFTSTLAAGTAADLAGVWPVNVDLTSLGNQSTTVSFRIYAFNAAGGPVPGWVGLRGDPLGTLGIDVAGTTMFDGTPTFDVVGQFVYEDRIWDTQGFTGATQQLPLRFLDVELVDVNTTNVIATVETDGAGNFSVQVTMGGLISLQVRALAKTGVSQGSRIKVATDIQGLDVLSYSTMPVGHDGSPVLDLGTIVIADTDGTGLAQAFNILDLGMHARDWLLQPQILGSFPFPIFFVWGPTEGINRIGSVAEVSHKYVFITSPGSGSSDGWSDMEILKGIGSLFLGIFSQSSTSFTPLNVFGSNYGDSRRAYPAAASTVIAGQLRAYMIANGVADDDISKFVDVTTLPAPPTAGGLVDFYDFETLQYADTTPINGRGQASEAAVVAALWDIFDGPATPDATPGVDDDPLDGSASDMWATFEELANLDPGEIITFEDWVTAWDVANGPGYLAAELTAVLETVNQMDFAPDAAEPNDDPLSATSATVQSYSNQGPAGGVVINEIDLREGFNQVELYNSGDTAVDLTGWKIVGKTNAFSGLFAQMATFPSFVLQPGAFVVVQEGFNQRNTTTHLFDPNFDAQYETTLAGSCYLRDDVGNPMDFVRWSGSDGPSATPIPPGATFTGTLMAPDWDETLGRDVIGTDTDDASDWTSDVWSLGQPNGLASIQSTFYGPGDTDVYSVRLEAGKFYSAWAFDALGNADPEIELLDTDGQTVLLSNQNVVPPPELTSQSSSLRDATMTFGIVHTGDYYVRVIHDDDLTDTGTYRFRAFERPISVGLLPPLAATIVAQNSAPVGDQVYITWSSGSEYDLVQFDVTGPTSLSDQLPGVDGRYFAYLDQGVHQVTFHAEKGFLMTPLQREYVYAGPVPPFHTEDFEDPALGDWELGHLWDATTDLQAGGARSLRDNALGTYQNNLDARATLHVPVDIGGNGTLTFSTICITEAGADFGRVEVTDDGGQTWDLLAQYDEDDFPGWADGTADNGDWETQVLSLSAYQGKRIKIRFRLLTDGANTREGWLIDDVDVDSDRATAVPGIIRFENSLSAGHPNPFNPVTKISYSLASAGPAKLVVYNVRGRKVRTLIDGHQTPGQHSVHWHGQDDSGAAVASGVYYYRLTTASFDQTRKLVLVE